MKTLLWVILIVSMFITVSCSRQEQKTSADSSGADKKKAVVEATGVVKSQNIKNVNIDFPAFVDKVYVKNGQRIKKGENLVSLDLKDFYAQISAKEHELNIETIQLKNIQEKVNKNNTSSPEVKKLLNDLKFAEDLYKKSQDELSKQEVLFNSGTISQHELDESKKTVEARKKDVEDIQYSLDSTEYNMSIDANEIKVQREKVASIQAELKVLKEKLLKSCINKNSVISDVESGIVYDIGYVEGDSIKDRKLLSIMDLSSVIVEANVPEEFIKDVKIEAEVIIHPVSDNSKSYKGRVTKISDMAIDQNGQTLIPVYISIENIDENLKPNYNVDVEISIGNN